MEKKKQIEVLAAEVIEKLKQLNYAYHTICGYRASFNRICAFARDRDELYFSEEFGREYLRQKYSCTADYYLEAFPQKAKPAIRSIRLLGDYSVAWRYPPQNCKAKGIRKATTV